MKKKIISFAAVIALSLTAAALTAQAAQASASNPIDISENFDTASPTGEEVYTGRGQDYTWNILATRDFGYESGNAYVQIPDDNKTAVSLTANNDNNGKKRAILAIPKGAGGIDRDIDITLDADVCAGFSQAVKAWDLVFSSSDGTEMFSLEFRNGGGAIVAALSAGGTVQDTNYSFTAKSFTKVSATVSFEQGGGGYVTFGNVSADFEGGSDVAEIAVRSSSAQDYSRPFVIDNFTMKTYDKTQMFFDVTSTGEGQSVKGTELSIDSHTYTLGADGVLSKYLRPDTTYPYTVKLPNHEVKEGSVKPLTADKYVDTYTFSNVDKRHPTLIHAYYNEDGALSSVTSDEVPVNNNTYSVKGERRHGYEEKFFLWKSLTGMEPYAPPSLTAGVSDTIEVPLQYHETVVPDKIELSGGSEYLYIPSEGYASTAEITTTVYDDLGFVMNNAVIDWSLDETASIGIANGVVTIGSDYDYAGSAQHTVKVKASVRGSDVYAEKNLIIRKVTDVASFEITGPVVIKNGTAAQYTVTGVKDAYGEEIDELPEFTLTAAYNDGTPLDGEYSASGLTIMPNIDMGSVREKKIKVTITLSGTEKKWERTATVYNYDFYEPGVGTASYGDPRMENINGTASIVWPATQSGTKTTVIPLPEPVNLTAGSCKVITYDKYATVDTVSGQERSLRITNSDGVEIVNLRFTNKTVNKVHNVDVLNTFSTSEDKSIGYFALNTKSSTVITLKTDTQGITTVSFAIDGNSVAEEYTAGVVYDIAEIHMRGGTSAPDARLLSLTNIKIDDGVPNAVEITGSDKIAIVNGASAKKQFGVKVFNQEDGETFDWSVTNSGNNPVDGVSIDQDGVLTVSDSVKTMVDASSLKDSGTKYINAIVKYTGSEGHSAQKTIKIMDYAGVSGFNLTGPQYIEAGKTSSVSYSISDIIDDYGNEADMQKAYMITTGEDIASIDMTTGYVTLTPGMTGTFTVTAAVGNPDKTKVVDLPVTVAKYSETGEATGDSVEVDVTNLANYSADTKYLVTTATDEGVLVNQTEQTASKDGKVTVDTTGADKYEVSPIYSYTGVGDISAGKTIPICDGTYDFTFKKKNTTRADIFVNGGMVGQNVDQVSIQRTLSGGSEYTARDIIVEGGKAVVVMKDNTSEMDDITVRKAPSIVKRKTHVYVLGDSLASAYYGEYDSVDGEGVPLAGTGQTGWGETLHYFLSDDMLVSNLAESGSAAATLYATTFQGVIQNAVEGDYLIMECGYQDGPNSTREMMLAALENIYKACKEKGVELILVTPNCAAHGTTNIAAISRDGGVRFGPDLMEFAEEKGILGVDLSGAYTEGNEYSMLAEFGEEYWLNNFNLVRPEDGVAVDRLHSSYWGAVLHSANILTVIDEAQQARNEEGEPTDLAERLSGIKLDYNNELVMTDSNGDTKTFKIGWYTGSRQEIPEEEENPQGE